MIDIDGREARFTLTRAFPCRPDVLYGWLTEPAKIARWSLAQVRMGGPFAVGATRTVTIRVGRLRVQELVERIVRAEPGKGFAYVGSSIAGHQGEVALRRLRLGSELHWQAAFLAPHPVLAWPIARFVSQQLSQSFTQLARVLAAEAGARAAELLPER